VKRENPDAVVIAAGSVPLPPPISGIENIQLTYPEDVLMERVTVGDRVLIIDEDNHHKGPATAEFLVERGKQVEVISSLFSIGEDIDISTKPLIYQRLFSKGVILSSNTAAKEVLEDRVLVSNVWSGEQRVIEGVDTIIYAGLRKASDELYKALKGEVSELYLVGDAMAPRKTHDAILEGTRVARKI
ncbi:MAG: NADH oxidase, partial [Dehalococcoidia bacterium]